MSNKNKATLIGHYGGDRTHCQAAWTSTGKALTPEQEVRIPALLKMLVEGSDGEPHGTPFERSLLHFQLTVDVASHVHLLKHRMFSINGESARYKEYTEDKYYIPNDWPEDSCLGIALSNHTKDAYAQYHSTVLELGVWGLNRKRAKESARFFLPYALQVNLDMSCNFRSFVHFLKLRNAPGAQKEIRELAQAMLDCVKTETNDEFKYSIEAWGL